LITNRLETISVSWKDTDEGLKRVSKMITDHERFVNEVRRTSGQGLQGIRNEYKSFEVGFLSSFLILVFFFNF